VDCVEAAVRPVCGDEASDWQDEYVAKLHQPALDYIGCSGKIMRFSQLHSVQFLTPLGPINAPANTLTVKYCFVGRFFTTF